MTGFASKILVLPIDNDARINMEMSLKTLNSRFFETTCKLPYALSNLETEFTKILKQRLLRGHIYLTIRMGGQGLILDSVEPALPMVRGYLDAAEKIKKQFNIPGTVTINDLLQLPDIFSVEEKAINEQITKKLFDALNELIDGVIAARQKEGEALESDLQKRASIMQEGIEQINSISLALLETQKQKVADLIKELETTENEQADSRKQALYYALDKMDIHEEVVRFKSHLANLHAQLTSPEIEKGKRLDFTLQELAREINTITAKCSDAPISSLAINVKVELEKMREQVQNII